MTSAELSRVPLAAQVAARIRDDIIHQELEPGARLSENALVARYAVSRTPIREALRTLESEGIVVRTGPGSIAVPPMTREDARQLYESCAVLDGLAARLLATTFSPEAELALSRCLRSIAPAVEAGDRALVVSLEAEFHALLGRFAGNDYLLRFLRSVAAPLDRYRRFNERNNPQRAGTTVTDLHAIFDALRSGDPDAAQAAAEQHVLDHLASLLEHLPEDD